jgi:hypothetical protein
MMSIVDTQQITPMAIKVFQPVFTGISYPKTDPQSTTALKAENQRCRKQNVFGSIASLAPFVLSL